jgi:prefoldin subunit 5
MTDNQLAERIDGIQSDQVELATTLAVLTQKMESIEDKFNTAIQFLTEKTDIVLTNLTERLERANEIDEKLINRLDQMAELFHKTDTRLQRTEDFVEKRQKIETWGKKTLFSVIAAGIGALLPKLYELIGLLVH